MQSRFLPSFLGAVEAASLPDTVIETLQSYTCLSPRGLKTAFAESKDCNESPTSLFNFASSAQRRVQTERISDHQS